MVGVEVEDVEYVDSDAEEFVSHIETAVSEVLSYKMQKPLQIRQEIIFRWKWRTSFTFKVYSVWQ